MKKAKIVEEILDLEIYGWRKEIIRWLVVEEVCNIAITLYGGQVHVKTGFILDDKRVISEVDVPDEVVEKALMLVHAKEELATFKHKVEILIG